jgi:hypothetical protein
MSSQWALQYFAPSVGTQLQVEFAHFLGFVVIDRLLGPIQDQKQQMRAARHTVVSSGEVPVRRPPDR